MEVRMKFIKYLIFSLLLSVFGMAKADGQPAGKFSGYMFGDYYYVAANHNVDWEKLNGIWFRRIYFTYDRNLSEAFSVRFRLEMAHPGDFSTKATAVPFVKDAYLKYKTGKNQIILGISPTPTIEIYDKMWGYRAVEKSPLDLQKFASSREFGVTFSGALDEDSRVKYHLTLANGNGNKSETNKGKKAILALDFYPIKNFVIELYGDYDDLPGKNDWYTAELFAAYKTRKVRVGVMFARQTRKAEVGKDLNLEIASAFLTSKVSGKTKLFVRVDRMFDPNPRGNKIAYIPFDPTAKSTFMVGGLDFAPIKDVHFMPNIETVVYGKNENGVKPNTDIIPRLTFFYRF